MPDKTDNIVNNCFHPEKGKPGLRKIPANAELSKKHIEKSHQNLRAMDKMFEGDLFDWTIVCGYYAIYHAVLASLVKIGIRASTHFCAIAAFKNFYVERGKTPPEYTAYIKKAKQLEQKYAETLEIARDKRVVEQYGVKSFSHDDAEWIIEEAKNFVLEIEGLLTE